MQIGARIRKIRISQKRTLQQIADAAGFTRSLISKIENGRTVPPVATLDKIARSLGVRVAELIEPAGPDGTVFTPAARIDERQMIATDKGYLFHMFASGAPDKPFQPFFFVAERGKVRPQPLSHAGHEFVYVLTGRMIYRVGSVTYTLGPGDSLYFDGLDRHELEPISKKVEYLAIFSSQSDERNKPSNVKGKNAGNKNSPRKRNLRQ